jgi:hypothetical protein
MAHMSVPASTCISDIDVSLEVVLQAPREHPRVDRNT